MAKDGYVLQNLEMFTKSVTTMPDKNLCQTIYKGVLL